MFFFPLQLQLSNEMRVLSPFWWSALCVCVCPFDFHVLPSLLPWIFSLMPPVCDSMWLLTYKRAFLLFPLCVTECLLLPSDLPHFAFNPLPPQLLSWILCIRDCEREISVVSVCVWVCLWGGGLGERISEAFLVTVRRQPGKPLLSKRVGGGWERCFIYIHSVTPVIYQLCDTM